MPNQPKKVRIEVVKHLATEALNAMDGCGVDNLTVAELTSACFTLTSNVVRVLMEQSTEQDRENNRSEVIEAVMKIYNIVRVENPN